MKIAILGTGAIGSTLAYQLAKAGHAVTTVARGARLEALQRDQAIVLVSGERQSVTVAAALDPIVAYDLVLVTVLATQVDDVLPVLHASAAKRVMFLFNTFEPLDRLREGVGASRAAFGFPMGILGRLIDGKLKMQIRAGTTMDDTEVARVLTAAGVPTVVEADMFSWLRAHAALVIPLMASAVLVVKARKGNTWQEARRFALAMVSAFAIVRDLGHPIKPALVHRISRLPVLILTALLWLMSRTEVTRELGALGPTEARMLVDMMSAAAPGKTGALLAVRP